MSERTQASDFLSASRDYLDGKTNSQQAANTLGDQLHQMLTNGSWKDAMHEMQRQGDPKGWHFAPVVICHGDDVISTCDISAPGLDVWAKKNRHITFTDHMHDSARLQVGHYSGNDFVADRTVADPVLTAPPKTQSLPFSDSLTAVHRGHDIPLQDFPNGHFTPIYDSAELERLTLKSPTERATVKNLYLNGGNELDGNALHTALKLPNVEKLLLGCRASDDDMKSLPRMRNLNTFIFTVDSNNITSEGLKQVSQIQHLRRLDLSETNIGGNDLEKLTSPTLKELHLGNETSNESFKYLARLKNLETLQLTFGKFTEDGLKQLAESKSLKHLVLRFPPMISAARVEELRKQLPGVQIDYQSPAY